MIPALVCLHLMFFSHPRPRIWIEPLPPIPRGLHFASFAAAGADFSATTLNHDSWGRHFREYDPLARPVVNLPTPAYGSASTGVTLGINLLADRMNRSPRWHRWARPLLYAQIGANLAGVATNAANRRGKK